MFNETQTYPSDCKTYTVTLKYTLSISAIAIWKGFRSTALVSIHFIWLKVFRLHKNNCTSNQIRKSSPLGALLSKYKAIYTICNQPKSSTKKTNPKSSWHGTRRPAIKDSVSIFRPCFFLHWQQIDGCRQCRNCCGFVVKIRLEPLRRMCTPTVFIRECKHIFLKRDWKQGKKIKKKKFQNVKREHWRINAHNKALRNFEQEHVGGWREQKNLNSSRKIGPMMKEHFAFSDENMSMFDCVVDIC